MAKFSAISKHFDTDGSSDSPFIVARSLKQSTNVASPVQFAPLRVTEKMEYVVTFDADGGIATATTATGFVGEKIGSLPTASRGEDLFIGWFDTNGVEVTENTVYSSSVKTVTARWIEPTTITFDPNGGTLSGATTIRAYVGYPLSASGDAFPSATGPAENPNLGGWYTSPVGGVKITPSTVYDGSYTAIYPHYVSKSFEVDLSYGWMLYEETDEYVKYVSTRHEDDFAQKIRIRVNGFNEFLVKIRSEAESSYDYTVAFEPDFEPSDSAYDSDASPWGDWSQGVYASTCDRQWEDVDVSYALDGGEHDIWFTYRKDSSYGEDPDVGYIIILKGQ